MLDSPDFESIKQVSPYGKEYWSARDLMPLLGYNKWERFEGAVRRAMQACEQTGNNPADHFPISGKMIVAGKGAKREVTDYTLSRFACYLIAQNGEPSKPEIASAQVYFAIATRENELRRLADEQAERIALRERVSENVKALNDAAKVAGVLPENFGVFHDAGYKAMYGGLGVKGIKARKGIGVKEDLLDRAGRAELAANDFRVTQTEGRLRNEGIIGQSKAVETHREVGTEVRAAIERIGGTMPEDLPAEPSLRPLLNQRKRAKAKSLPEPGQAQMFSEEEKPDK